MVLFLIATNTCWASCSAENNWGWLGGHCSQQTYSYQSLFNWVCKHLACSSHPSKMPVGLIKQYYTTLSQLCVTGSHSQLCVAGSCYPICVSLGYTNPICVCHRATCYPSCVGHWVTSPAVCRWVILCQLCVLLGHTKNLVTLSQLCVHCLWPCPHWGFRINSDSMLVWTPCLFTLVKTGFAKTGSGGSFGKFDSAEANLQCSVDKSNWNWLCSACACAQLVNKWQCLVCTRPCVVIMVAPHSLLVVYLVSCCTFFKDAWRPGERQKWNC